MTLEALSKLHNNLTTHIEDNDIRSSFTIMRQNRNIFKDFKTLEDEYTQNDYKGTTLANFKNRLLILVDSAVHNKENSINTAKSNQEPEVAEFASLQQKITDAKDELQSLKEQIAQAKLGLKSLDSEKTNTSKSTQITDNQETTSFLLKKAQEWFERASKLLTYKEKLQAYDRAINIHSEYAEAYFERGNVKLETKDVYGAIEDFAKAKGYNQDFIDAYFKSGETLLEIEDFEMAIFDFDYIISHNKNLSYVLKSYYKRGICKYNLQKYREAIDDFTEVILLDSFPIVDVDYYLHRAYCHGFLSDEISVFEDLKIVIEYGNSYIVNKDEIFYHKAFEWLRNDSNFKEFIYGARSFFDDALPF